MPKKPNASGRKQERLPRQAIFVQAFDVEPNLNHPLAGLSQEQRTAARIRALAEVLANVAMRRAKKTDD